MKPSEVGFNGSFKIWCKGIAPKPLTINLARSKNNKPEFFDTEQNENFQLKNTFIWWNKDNPELLYRDNDGQLHVVNFEPFKV